MSRVFGRYTLNERIGAGGMGEVYRATKSGPEGFEVRVAVKLILPQFAKETSFQRLFSREARLAALLKHPNIVNVNGFDILEGSPFIEMEYVEGSNLASLIKSLDEEKTLPLEEAVHIIHSAARGLAYAHSFNEHPTGVTGIIHRDFNPHNLLISVEGEVKITDFGIARAATGGTAALSTLMGKLAYMSPEQIEAKHLDHRSDLFSLGITAYQLLAGRHPFQRASEAGTLRAVQEASFQPLFQCVPTLPSSLSNTVDSLLCLSPDDRPETARNVADVFEEYLKPASVKALGRRIRSIKDSTKRVPEESRTGPTLPVQSARRLAWPAVLVILSVAVIMGFLKAGQPSLEEAGPSNFQSSIQPARAGDNRPAEAETSLDETGVLLTSTPDGALVSEGDSILGRTPLSITIPAGVVSKEVKVLMDRYEPVRVSLTRDSMNSNVALTLAELPTATMRIGAIPWARVGIGDEIKGVTPVVMEDMPIGTHTLVLSNSELGIQREVTVTVEEGEDPVYVVDMATGKIVQSSE